MATEDRLGGKKTLKVAGILDDIEKDEVKKRVDIVTLFASFGVSLVEKGKGFTGRCPWHEDATPSLSVDRIKGLYNCFGCGESGDVVTLVEKMKSYNFREAMDYLKKESLSGVFTHSPKLQAEKVTTILPQAEKQSASPAVPIEQKLVPEKLITPPLPELTLSTVSDYYHKTLLKNPQALAYLKQRGFKDAGLYSRFAIGYADGSLLSKVASGHREHLKTLGILNTAGYEHFNGCITIPLYDEAGQIVSMYGRKLDEKAEVKHLYLSGGHKGLVNPKAAQVYDELIFTEAIIDALSLFSLGIENVIPLYGTNGLTLDHLAACKAHRVKTLILALDNDESGQAAAVKLKEKLLSLGYSIKTVFPPSGKDWNEALTAGILSKELVQKAVTEAKLATPPKAETEKLKVKKEGSVYWFTLGELEYRLIGVKDLFVSSLRVNIKAKREALSSYDTCDLYSARSRETYAAKLSGLFNTEQGRIERDLITMLEYLEAEREKKLFSEETQNLTEPTAAEKATALNFLHSPDIGAEIVADFAALGYIGEEVNTLLAYFAATSRLLDDPLNLYIQAGSSTGKSFLLDTLKELVPPESLLSSSSFSDTALYYFEEEGFFEKVFLMGEAIHDPKIEAQVRQMQSEHEISRWVTMKNEKTGELKTECIRKEVKMSFMMSSTALALNPENASRCLVIHTDESKNQTERVQQRQRAEDSSIVEKLKREELKKALIKKHITAQRLLQKKLIYNPLAPYIQFPKARPSMRRAQKQFLTLIKSIAFLRQFQKQEEEFESPESGARFKAIACDLADYELARRLYSEGILQANLADIPKGAVNLYESLRKLAAGIAAEQGIAIEEVKLFQRQVREYTGLGVETVKQYIRLLVEYEYLRVRSGRQHGTRFAYSLFEDKSIGELEAEALPTLRELEGSMEAGKA